MNETGSRVASSGVGGIRPIEPTTARRWRVLLAGVAAAALLAAPVQGASSPSGFPEAGAGELRVDAWTLDGGGGRSSGDGLQVDGTFGQPDAGRAAGGGYRLEGGFWSTEPPELFLDGFETGDASRWSATFPAAD